jgi:hypothetical protein
MVAPFRLLPPTNVDQKCDAPHDDGEPKASEADPLKDQIHNEAGIGVRMRKGDVRAAGTKYH